MRVAIETLASSAAGRKLVPLPSGRGAAVLARSLDIDADEHPGDVLVISAESHRLADGAAAEALGLDDAAKESKEQEDREVETWMSVAYEAMTSGDATRAEACYLAADQRLADESSPRRALVLVSLGDIARAEGRIEQAIEWFERALAMVPSHIGALRGRAAIALDRGEHAQAAALHHRLVASLATDVERTETLSMIATQCLAAADDAIRRALELDPGERSLLERLRAVHEARGRWDEAVGVAVQLAEGTGSREQRARALVEAARFCSRRTGNIARAVGLYEAAMEDDPRVPGAFTAIENELLRAEDFRGVAAAYERQLDRLVGTDARAERCRILGRLAEIERDRLHNAPAALFALRRLVELAPEDALSRVALAELLASTKDMEAAVGELEAAAELQPSRFETYRFLYELFSSMRDEDRAYAAGGALVALGEADINEQMTYAQHSPSTVLAPRRRFDVEAWHALSPPRHERELDRVTAALEAPAIASWLASPPDRAARV